MIQEDKELLLKDLCARLPYGVVIRTWYGKRINIKCISVNVYTNAVELDIPEDDDAKVFIDNVKPYLFPLSSMTEEQFVELKVFADLTDELELVEWNDNYKTLEFWLEEVPSYCVIKVFDWLNRNHFDYRELIEKGLAIDATGKNIY